MEKPNTLEHYYLSKPEPHQGCLLALRDIILSTNSEIITVRKYQIPYFIYKGKKLAYLWLNGKKLMLGFCMDKSLQMQMDPGVKPKDKYESIQIDPNIDLPVDDILLKLTYYISVAEGA